MDFCKQFNARTQDRAGKSITSCYYCFQDNSFDFIIKTPPVASQLLEATKKKAVLQNQTELKLRK